jgi:crotonobetainyl-CoA:carnitine CoA-transferase CaiB-like acyl-CoA transferase
MTRFMSPRIVPFLGSGTMFRRSGGKDSVIAIYQTFNTADHPITLGLGNNGIWQRFCKAVGRDDMGEDPRYAENVGRREFRAEIVAEIESILITQPRSHWLPVFAAARIPAGPINRVDQVTQEPVLLERGLFYSAERNAHPIPQVGLGIAFDGNNHTYRKAPPRLGEDTRTVFSDWLGWNDQQIDDLAARGVL